MIDLQEFHAQLLDILLEFDRICRLNDIKYSLAYGTLLGAVRHKGFIPWDDDVDVIMDRINFEKFCHVCQDYIGEEYFFQSKVTEEKYPYNICRLRKNNTAMIYEEWRKSDIHLGIYIDIYPVDKLPDQRIKRIIQKAFIVFLTPIRITRNPVIYRSGGKKRFSRGVYVLKNLFYYVAKIFPKKACDKLEQYYITKYNGTNGEKCGVICEGGTLLSPARDNLPFPVTYMSKYEEIEFEGHSLMVTSNSHEILEHWYGDYMKLPPEEKRVMYHQPDVFDTKKSYKEYI